MTTTADERMLEKVRALLAKAEASTFAEEAEAFSSKAQELMARYAIERAMLEGLVGDGDPVTTEIRIPDPYASAKFALLSAVSQPNRCRALYDRERRVGIVVGFPADLETVELLYTSLLLQATRLVSAHGSRHDALGTNRTRSFRNAFLQAFAAAIGARFEANRERAEAEVAADGLPVLASRAERVERIIEEQFPRVRTMRSSVSNAAGYRAGRDAGTTADLGTDRLGGKRAGLASG